VDSPFRLPDLPGPAHLAAPAPHAFDRRAGAGVLLVSLVLLALELVLSRILAVAMGYHFVFLVVSLAVLGVTAGSLAVLLAPGLFPHDRTRERLAAAALLLAALLLAAWALFLLLDRSPALAHRLLAPFHEPFGEPFGRRPAGGLLAGGLLAPFAALVVAASLPFAAGGTVAALAMARFPWSAARVYAWDLAGAGAGVLAAVAVMTATTPFVCLPLLASASALAAVLFAPRARRGLRRAAAAGVALGLAVAAATSAFGLVGLPLVRGRYEPDLAVVRWNAWSRVAAYPLRTGQSEGAWGLSRAFRGPLPEQMGLVVDDTGYSTVVRYAKGDDLSWAQWSLAALPWLLRPEADSLVIGPGGGRDLLVARAMGAARVRAVEVNPLVVRVVQEDLGDFSGRPYTLPGVETVVAEGRSWLQRDPERYDVVEAALVYGPTAPAEGAWTFTEDHLATLEAFHDLLAHLSEGGILAVTRLAAEASFPRLVATARRALEEGGVDRPGSHVFIAAERGLATILVGQEAFTDGETMLLERACAALGYEVLYSPAGDGESLPYLILREKDLGKLASGLDRDILPATDDRPYVNALLRPGDLLRGARGADAADRALLLLRSILVALVALAVALLALPLLARLRLRKASAEAAAPPWRVAGEGARTGPVLAAALYFGALGVGFALVEVVLAKRLVLLVGSPGPAIAVVLGAFLAAAGAGSMHARHLVGLRATLRARCGALTVSLLLAGILLPAVVEVSVGSPLAVRLLVAASVAAGLGYLAGHPFPLGMALLASRQPRLVPWAWALNGACGALGAALGLLLSVGLGFTEAMMAGPACYLLAGAVAELL